MSNETFYPKALVFEKLRLLLPNDVFIVKKSGNIECFMTALQMAQGDYLLKREPL